MNYNVVFQTTHIGTPLSKTKTFLSLKISFLLLLTLLYLNAGAFAFNQLVTLSEKNASIEKVLIQIKKQTGYSFLYDKELLKNARLVTINVSKAPLDEVMKKCFADQSFTYEILDKAILIKPNAQPKKSVSVQESSSVQAITITGKVTDSQGGALVGVSVLLKGSTTGTSTDANGKYTLSIQADGILSFSYIGFTTQEVATTGRSILNVTLLEETKSLNTVVVVGYGSQQKRDITGSVGQVKASDIKDQAVTGFDQALVGKISGVQVLQPNGAPGSAMAIRVRGLSSISAGNDPLYVVDGVPLSNNSDFSTAIVSNPLNTINPTDIESIEVLKDASAAAIYGSRGSNGVVLITTKRGSGGKAKFTYDGYAGVQQVVKKIDLLDAYQFAELTVEGINNAYSDAVPGANLDLSLNSSRPVSYRVPARYFPYLAGEKGLTDTDWQDAIFRTASMQNHTISVNGGTENVKFYISGNYLDQKGIIIGSGFKRYSGRVNVDGQSGKFHYGVNFTPSYTINNLVKTETRYTEGSIVAAALSIGPVFKVYNDDGSYNFDSTPGEGTKTWNINPVAMALLTKDRLTQSRILTNGFVEYSFLKNLTYKLSLGVDQNNYREDFYRPSNLPQMSGFGAGGVGSPSVPVGTSESRGIINWVVENTLNYTGSFGDHNVSGLLGYTNQKERIDGNFLRAENYPTDIIQTLNGGQITQGYSSLGKWSLISYLARLQYNYQHKYLLSATIRSDGSSRFGENNKYGYFPSVSAGWIISDEKFLKDSRTLSLLKLKASYGLTGNFQIPNYASYGLLGNANYVSGGTVTNGLSPTTVDNPSLRWEKTAMFDTGIEANFFGDKLQLQADYYNSNTYDMLLNVSVPLSSGFATQLKNIGKVNNRGFEFSANYRQNIGKWQLSVNGNIATNKNKVVELGPAGEPIYTNGASGSIEYVTMIGKPIGSYYGRVKDGIIMSQAELTTIPVTNSSKPGDFKFRDINGDNKIDDKDRTIIGDYFPDYTYGLTLNARYSNFDMSVTIQGSQGFEIVNLQRRYIYNFQGNFNSYTGAMDRWRSDENPGNGEVSEVNRVPTGDGGIFSSHHVEDGSYTRFKNITLGYTVPKNVLNALKITNARLYFSAQNPFTITKYMGYNPEVNNRPGSNLSPGEDYGSYPLAKTYVLGINFSF